MIRNILTVIGIFLAVILLMVVGDVITIGEKLTQITGTVWSEYGFYIALVLLLLWFVVRPIIQLHCAPTLPNLTTDGLRNEAELRRFGLQLAQNCDYIPTTKANREVKRKHVRDLEYTLRHSSGEARLREVVDRELRLRLEGDAELGEESRLGVVGINNQIRQWASSVFMVTAISPNSKIDTISVLVLNYQMIRSIVAATGFRPTNRQLFGLYWKVLTTALLSYVVSESLTDVGDIAPFEGLADDATAEAATDAAADGMTDAATEGVTDTMASDTGFSWTNILTKMKIPGLVAGPIMDGTFNALLTLRIGYVTRSYLFGGLAAYQGVSSRKARILMKRDAIRQAFKAVPAIVKEGIANIGKGVANTISA